ncbi:MAG: hypothetical protein QW076_02940 [Candidatus Anstonellales archaeon]
MKKGLEFSINLIVAFILFILAVIVFWLAFNPVGKVEEARGLKTDFCKTDTDCSSNIEGTRCLITFPGDYNFTPFCGCLTTNDCKVGYCDSNNKCS